ncbi:MAG: glycosyltransferase family 4 protein [Aphanocapsa sp. GSE-SYN-MK-11-07L]|jgi:glycosyltransferase involved in cell wall biosynthesis|nr:glycosyltransferase family 4 protein [Aphanocapsa sp. GSE-SYN-MK-11-07L]
MSEPNELIVLPAVCNVLGGTLVTLALLIKGARGSQTKLRVLVRSGSAMETYLRQLGHADCLQMIPGSTNQEFLRQALVWVSQQPSEIPLLLDNCVDRSVISVMLQFALPLRLSGRPVYHFFHDLARSYNLIGYLSRKLIFSLLAPRSICNSYFTASHIRALTPNVYGILYQPVDSEKFNPDFPVQPPTALLPILQSGAKLLLTPSRINTAGIVNDKNLRGLIPVLAELKSRGLFYHGVVVGEDRSPDQSNSQELLNLAEQAGVADRFTILPASFAIQDYYRFADVMVTLAPREPFGRVVVEAIACGAPVVGSCTGGIGEVLSQCAPDWRVDPADPVAVATKIHHLATEPETPQTIAQAQAWVAEHCGVDKYAHALLEITKTHAPKLIEDARTVPHLSSKG